MRGIAIGGFMATGKSTVGPLVAARLSLPCVDLDAAIAQQAGDPIPVIFTRDGEDAFRALESAVLRSLCRQGPMVLALGGGTLHQRGNLALLRASFSVVVLTASLPVLRARVGAGRGRPLWRDAEALYTARLPGYRAAGPQIPVDDLSPAAIAERVLAAAEERAQWC